MYSSVSSEIAVQSLNLLPHILHSSGFSPTELSLNLVEVVFGGEGFFVDEFGICKKSHLNGFALLCVRQCVFRLPMLINLLLHASHLTDFRGAVLRAYRGAETFITDCMAIKIILMMITRGLYLTRSGSGEINTVECDEAGECSNSQSHRARKRIKLAGDINSDESNLTALYFKYMACAVPILDSVGKYLAALPSSDLLPVRISSKSLCVFATEVLLRRIKPLFIKDGNITNPIDRWIFPTYETSEDIYRDFFAVAKWQSQFSLGESSHLESKKRKPASLTTFASALPKMPYFFRMRTHQISLLSRAPSFRGSWLHKEAKLVFIFSSLSWSQMESITSDILSIRENRSLSIIYVKSYFPHVPSYYYPFSSIIFHGSNVEASTFLVKTKDEKELREELLEWKRGLDFLKNYNIIAFYFMENMMITTNGKIFREIFNTEPFSVRFHKYWSKDVGIVHLNSTTSSLNDGSVFAIIGFKKYWPYSVKN
ncbi:hypothetical protein DINM_000968 [Dirofilaria immitis]|nr:hypothetical protein [Dirofilaria immitis]